jgi:hypothetical protein
MPSEADIAAEFGLGTWELEGKIAGANGTNESLTVALLTGAWGGQSASGTWGIAPGFWTTYGNAVITLHAGNGGGEPDHFSFLVEPGELSGTWTYQVNSGTGGGFSNLRLFGTGEPEVQTNLPDGGTTLILLGLGVACIGLVQQLNSVPPGHYVPRGQAGVRPWVRP